MAEKKSYTVHRAMHGEGRDYARGDTRDLTPADAAPLLAIGALAEKGSDGEKFRAGERASEIGARFTVRYSSQVADVSPKHRLIFSGRPYAITRVKEVGRRVALEITVVGRDDDGE